jgi:hypothetical protein
MSTSRFLFYRLIWYITDVFIFVVLYGIALMDVEKSKNATWWKYENKKVCDLWSNDAIGSWSTSPP